MDYSVIPVYFVLALIIFGIIFRKELRAWRIRQKLKAAGIPAGTARSRLHYATQTLQAAIEADVAPVVPEGRMA